jgi:hypothetical protein
LKTSKETVERLDHPTPPETGTFIKRPSKRRRNSEFCGERERGEREEEREERMGERVRDKRRERESEGGERKSKRNRKSMSHREGEIE